MYFLPANTEDTNATSMQLYLNVLQIRRRKNTHAHTHRQIFNSTQSEENYDREAVRSDCLAEWSNSIDEECFTWQDRKTSKVSISSSSSPMNTKECVARRKYKTQVFLLRKNLQPPWTALHSFQHMELFLFSVETVWLFMTKPSLELASNQSIVYQHPT